MIGPTTGLNLEIIYAYNWRSFHTNPNSIKGAAKLYFMHYSRAVIISFGTGSYKSAFSPYFLVKLSFRLSVFGFFVFLYFWFYLFSFSVLYFELNVITKMIETIRCPSLFWLLLNVSQHTF